MKLTQGTKPEFKIGDWIEIVNCLYSLTGYDDFFKENGLEQFAGKFAHESTINNEKYKIVATGEHFESNLHGTIYVLEKDDKIYLMYNGYIDYPGDIGFVPAEPPNPEFKIGDKFVPISKSTNGCTLEQVQDKMQIQECEYLTIKSPNVPWKGKNVVEAGNKSCGYWYFLKSDLRPYELKEDLEFKVGDRVIGIQNAFAGETGTIIAYSFDCDLPYGIRWDKPIPQGHSLDGLCELGCGWWVSDEHIKHLKLQDHRPKNRTEIDTQVKYVFCENVITCVITEHEKEFTGIKEYSPCDKWDEETGKKIAYLRAEIAKNIWKLKQLCE